jgi:hypothetical protein
VICTTDIRGRRGDLEYELPEIEILNPGRDADWEGLCVIHEGVSQSDTDPEQFSL